MKQVQILLITIPLIVVSYCCSAQQVNDELNSNRKVSERVAAKAVPVAVETYSSSKAVSDETPGLEDRIIEVRLEASKTRSNAASPKAVRVRPKPESDKSAAE